MPPARRDLSCEFLGPRGAVFVLAFALGFGLTVGLLTGDGANGVAAGGLIVTIWAAAVAGWPTRKGKELEDGVDRLNRAVDRMEFAQDIGRVWALVPIVARVGLNIGLETHHGGFTRPTALAAAQEIGVAEMACEERGLPPPAPVREFARSLQFVGIPPGPGSPTVERPDDLEELAGRALEVALTGHSASLGRTRRLLSDLNREGTGGGGGGLPGRTQGTGGAA